MLEYVNETDLPLMLTVMEFAKLLRISKNTAYDYLRTGNIPYVKIGHQIRIFREDAISFIHGNLRKIDEQTAC